MAINKSETSSWSDITDIFKPEYQYEIVKSDGQIRLSRSKQIQGAAHKIVWQKECIQQSDPALGATEGARLTHKFLSAMSHHELAMLQAIATSGLRYCSLPFRILQENSYLRTVVIETVDAGPSLDFWRNLGRYMDGSPPDFFANPIALLRITRGILQALEEFHRVGNVHLDLAWRNVCLSLLEPMDLSPDLSRATLKPNWQTGVKLIDFGFSVGNNIIPPVWLMAAGQGTTTHRYKKQQDSIAKQAEVIFQRQTNNCNLPSNTEALVDPFWWQIDRRSHLLRQFSDNLDWREDIYALGNMLKEAMPIKHPNAEVNDLMASLPQTLINAGLSDDATRFAYQHWITKINAVLALCPNDIKATDELTIVNRKSDDPTGGAGRDHSVSPYVAADEQKRQEEERERQREIERLAKEAAELAEQKRQEEELEKQLEKERLAKEAAKLAVQKRQEEECERQRRKAVYRKLLVNGFLRIVLLSSLAWGVLNLYQFGANAYHNWQTQQQYQRETDEIEQSAWWKRERKAAPQEIEWLERTQDLAAEGIPYAQYMKAVVVCYGMVEGNLANIQAQNIAACAGELGEAVGKMLKYPPSIIGIDRSKLAYELYYLLRETVYSNSPAVSSSGILLSALLPYLPDLAAYDVNMAMTWADVQACHLHNKNAARETLQNLVVRFSDPDVAKLAERHFLSYEREDCPG